MKDTLVAPKKKENLNWFENWFDSDFYHVLYKERDETEASKFIFALNQEFGFIAGQKVLDLACGRGRHTRYLASLGLEASGFDLSKSSIEFARKACDRAIQFEVKDMREEFGNETFDVILNLFTSFGYYENDYENLKVVQNMVQALKPNGLLIIDFLNPNSTRETLKPKENKQVNGLKFKLLRYIQNNFLHKRIEFEFGGKTHVVTEKVMLIEAETFKAYFENCRLVLLHVYGDYSLNSFQENTSPRMIFVVKKNLI